MRRSVLALSTGLAPLALVVAAAACGEDLGEPAEIESAIDAAPRTAGDAGRSTPYTDTTPPGAVRDLLAKAATHTSVELSFTAPGGDGDLGRADAYELRWSKTPILDLPAFEAATAATAPSPLSAGTPQRFTVEGLAPGAALHFALRARDAAGNAGPLSNDTLVTTKTRASFLVSEIAPVNSEADGGDFVELVATKPGWAKGIEVRHVASSASVVLHALAGLDVAVGDRLVVHARGLPGPAGFAQEDATGDVASSTEPFASPAAIDVYATATGLVSTNGLVTVTDGAAVIDAVPYSTRATDASTAAMTAFAAAHAANAWTWKAAPVDGADDCATLLEVVNANGSATTPPSCGGYPGFLAAGSSIQRNGIVDTNTRADFHVAPQTRGAANAPFCDPEGARLLVTEVNPAPVNLLELVATRGGALRGFSIRRNPTAAAPGGTEVLAGGTTSPMPSICLVAGDVIVVHLGAADGTASESASKTELPADANPGYFDGAWDVATTTPSSSLALATSTVVAVRDPSGTYVEAAAFTSGTTTASATFNAAVQHVQGLGLWMPASCNGQPCDNTTTPTARDLAAVWSGVGATADGASCRRAPGGAPLAASFGVGASSFGAPNL